jgi:hypothetical protein
LNQGKSVLRCINDVRENGLGLLGSFIGPKEAREVFLKDKVEAEARKLERLTLLPHQHALLLLRFCIQQNLRHLQRSLRTDDLQHVWATMDRHLQTALRRISATGFHESDPMGPGEPQEELITLPARLGGVGLLSFHECAPIAYQAAAELADYIIGPLFATDAEAAQPRTQKERCFEVFAARRDGLFDRLSEAEQAMVLESASALGRAWLSIFPSIPHFRLSDAVISAGLHVRLLQPPRTRVCPRCLSPNTAAHSETCNLQTAWTTARHEIVKYSIGRALRSLPAAQVEYEPHLPGSTQRRHDIFFSGAVASGLADVYYDVSVVSLVSQVALRSYKNPLAQAEPGLSAVEVHLRKVERYLDGKASEKRRSLPVGGGDMPFTPVVMSAGGLMGSDMRKTMGMWKGAMSEAAYSYMRKSIAAGLLKARVGAIG